MWVEEIKKERERGGEGGRGGLLTAPRAYTLRLIFFSRALLRTFSLSAT